MLHCEVLAGTCRVSTAQPLPSPPTSYPYAISARADPVRHRAVVRVHVRLRPGDDEARQPEGRAHAHPRTRPRPRRAAAGGVRPSRDPPSRETGDGWVVTTVDGDGRGGYRRPAAAQARSADVTITGFALAVQCHTGGGRTAASLRLVASAACHHDAVWLALNNGLHRPLQL